MNGDVSNRTDREILISLHEKVEALKESTDKATSACNVCIADHEVRIRKIEQEGSNLAEETAKTVVSNTKRIDRLEKWKSNVMGQVTIIASVIALLAAKAESILGFLRGG